MAANQQIDTPVSYQFEDSRCWRVLSRGLGQRRDIVGNAISSRFCSQKLGGTLWIIPGIHR